VVALLRQDRLVEAGDAFKFAEQLCATDATSPDYDLNLGTVLQYLGRTDEAIEYFRERLPLHPDGAASGHYALALLTAGRLAEGWEMYEFRWLDARLGAKRARFDVPCWTGQPIVGKTVLLRCEQGAGDVFQFIRYAPMVKALGATVWLELRPGLGSLGNEFPGIDRLFGPGQPIPPFDFYADLLSLPRVFQTTLATIPNGVPYLRAPDSRRGEWRERIGPADSLKVGLVWAGDPNHVRDRQRSIPIAKLAPLVQMPCTRWYSLQKGSAAAALANTQFAEVVVDLGKDLYEYGDTAAAIEHLDLIVTVDTSVAHLAAGIGKEVWVLLSHVADWRWMESRDDTPWYPTMRLFRQRSPDNWDDVILRVRESLGIRVQERRADDEVALADPASAWCASDTPATASCRNFVELGSSVIGMPKVCRSRIGIFQYIDDANELSRALEHYGEYRQAEIDLLVRLVKPGAFVLEVGAGVGNHTIQLASMVAPDGYVLACENSTVLRSVLRQNLNANEVRHAGVFPNAIINAHAKRPKGSDFDAGLLTHGAYSVDQLCLDRLDLLKISEPDIGSQTLQGAEATLWRHRPLLLVSASSNADIARLRIQAGDLGYRCWVLELPLFDPGNFNRRNDNIYGDKLLHALLGIPEERGTAPGLQSVVGLIEFVGQ
jgi:tetratricopeptide (TPR) repeat protein